MGSRSPYRTSEIGEYQWQPWNYGTYVCRLGQEDGRWVQGGRNYRTFVPNNEILDDMMVVEGNLPPVTRRPSHRTSQATWRLLNTGVPNAKSRPHRIVDTCGNLETYSVIERTYADSTAIPQSSACPNPVPSLKVCRNRLLRPWSTATSSSTRTLHRSRPALLYRDRG